MTKYQIINRDGKVVLGSNSVDDLGDYLGVKPLGLLMRIHQGGGSFTRGRGAMTLIVTGPYVERGAS